MQFFTESYHESTLYAPRSSGDPVSLHWETVPLLDKKYPGKTRIQMPANMLPPLASVSADGINSVGVYVVLRNREIPDGVYYCDKENNQLVKVGEKSEMDEIASAFPGSEFVANVPTLYLFTGLLGRIVWRLKEAAYREVEKDVGSAVGNIVLFSKGRGFKTTVLGGFVDDSIANTLKLNSAEIPLSALAVYPDTFKVASVSFEEGAGEFAYSNRIETIENGFMDMPEKGLGNGYSSRFMLQNRCECIDDLSRCIRVCRLQTQALPGDEFPLTPAKFSNEFYYREVELLPENKFRICPFVPCNLDLDDFSSILRWLELGQVNMFGAGLLKIWVVAFNVMFVYGGVYRYVPVRKSLYMQSQEIPERKFMRCHAAPEQVQNSVFAIILTANLNESCTILGDRAYRYLNMNAGYIAESVHLSASFLNKASHTEHFYYEKELKTLCGIPENESILSEIVVGRAPKF